MSAAAGHSDSLRDEIVRAMCPGRYIGAYPKVWLARADAVLALVTAAHGETVTEWGVAWADQPKVVKWYDRDYVMAKATPPHGDVIYTRQRTVRPDVVTPWAPVQ